MTTNTKQKALHGFIKALLGNVATNNAHSIREQLLTLLAQMPSGTDFYNLCIAEIVTNLGVSSSHTPTLKLVA